ncbi:MAG: molybdopterin-dependent oxidoreductase [Pleurocapsa sp. SU_196_0]|nr:molybdopterin-dependent oxidoreductase [Pleurocapsa sp. SU_196_0]
MASNFLAICGISLNTAYRTSGSICIFIWFDAKAAPVSAASGAKLPDGITSQADLYYVSINNEALDPKINEVNWKLEVGGLVREPSSFTLQQLKESFAPKDLEFTMACISNPIGGDLIGNCVWTGLRVKDLLDNVGVQPGAKWIQWEADPMVSMNPCRSGWRSRKT